jgi:hypothetical protein
VIAYIYPDIAAPVGRFCAAGRSLTPRGCGGWFLHDDGVLPRRSGDSTDNGFCTLRASTTKSGSAGARVGLSLGGQVQAQELDAQSLTSMAR